MNLINYQKKLKKAKSTKGLKTDLLNSSKYFYWGVFQNYLVFNQPKNLSNILVTLLELICGNLMECQKKILKV